MVDRRELGVSNRRIKQIECTRKHSLVVYTRAKPRVSREGDGGMGCGSAGWDITTVM